MEWYYAEGENRMGPVDNATMDQLVRSGAVTAETYVWRDGMKDWQPLGSVAQVTPPAAAPAATPAAAANPAVPESLYGEQTMKGCVECGRAYYTGDMVPYRDQWVCAQCKDDFFQREREGGVSPTEMRYAGFWVRFSARFVDGIILNIASRGIGFAFVMAMGGLEGDASQRSEAAVLMSVAGLILTMTVLVVGYETFFLGKYGATPGKMATGLKVVRSDGSPLTYGRAFGRFFGYVLSGVVLYIGYIMAAFDEEKRSLHDRICDTRVIRK